MRVRCLGGVQTVTGSCFLCNHHGLSFLVDCGMFRGAGETEKRNRERFPFDPAELDAVLLTHAHIDHSGLLPRLVREGFEGKIYATPATLDLCRIMLPDSAHIQEMEAEWQTRKNLRRGSRPVAPLYTTRDAEQTFARFERVVYNVPFKLSEAVEARFLDAGHILGSSTIEIRFLAGADRKTVIFSGDLGQPGQFIVRDPAPLEQADFVFMESTYGNRLHRSMTETLEEFARILRTAERDRAKIVIPAFAVERTQEILFALYRLQAEKRVPSLPVYVDSPLAISATLLFRDHPECFDQETLEILQRGDNPLDPPNLTFTRTPEESKRLNDMPGPLIIISASGMCDAGRIKHHLKHNLWQEQNHVVIVGFQAQGTLGRKLVDGETRVRILQEDVQVRASIHTLGGFSGHADRDALLRWLGGCKRPIEKVFLIHGEQEVLRVFAERVRETLSLDVGVPALGEEVFLAATEEERQEELRTERDLELTLTAQDLARRMKSLSDRMAGRDWDEDPVLRHHLEKQLRKIRRLLEKLEQKTEKAA